jgi:hypothetical protein
VDAIFLAALTAGTTPIASTGATAAAVLHDIRLLLDGTGVSGDSRFHLIVPPTIAAHLAVMTTATIGGLAFPGITPTGGVIAGIAVHASDALTNTAVLLDASQVVAGADPVGISFSQSASLQMDSAPTQTIAAGSPPAPVASTVVSMFQTNASAIRAERRSSSRVLAVLAALGGESPIRRPAAGRLFGSAVAMPQAAKMGDKISAGVLAARLERADVFQRAALLQQFHAQLNGRF